MWTMPYLLERLYVRYLHAHITKDPKYLDE